MSGSCAVEPREANESQTDLQQIGVNGNVDIDTNANEPTVDDPTAK